MENPVFIIAKKEDLKSVFKEVLSESKSKEIDLESEKMSLSKAAKLASMTPATFSKRVKEGVFPKHGSGRKIFFLKSEVIEALTRSNQ